MSTTPAARRTGGRRRLRTTVALAALGLLVPALAGCGDMPFTGSSAPEPVAAIADLKGNTTQVVLDERFVGALGSLGVTPGTVGTARLVDGKLVFPITGGNVTVFEPGEVSPYVVGQLQHEGSGFTLSAGGTTVRISNLNVDPGVSRVYGDVAVDGATQVSSAYVFQLDGRTLEPLETSERTATLVGTEVKVSGVAAGLLNDVFATTAIEPGLLIGTAKITVKLPRADR